MADKGKKLRIDGITYRAVKRADGRYNLYKEGSKGAVGSTALISARDAKQNSVQIRALAAEFDSMQNQVTVDSSGTTTVENYNQSI